jgi:hypothetical protein
MRTNNYDVRFSFDIYVCELLAGAGALLVSAVKSFDI